MKCPKCGATNVHDASFCVRCGTPLAHSAAVGPASGPSAAPPAASAAALHLPGLHLPAGHLPGAHERSLQHWALAGVGVVIFYLCNVILSAMLQAAHNSVAVVILSGFMAVLLVPIYASLIVALDRHVTEPGWLLFGAFFWGAIVAAGIAFILNTKVLVFVAHLAGPKAAFLFVASFVAPVTEETAKGLALLLIFIFLRSQLNDVVDGIVLGGLVGLGFAMTENVSYYARIYLAGGVGALTLLFIIRSIFFGFGHVLYTACTGAGLGLAEETTSPIVRGVAPVAGYLLAIFLHFLWNTVASFVGGIQSAAVFLVFPFMTALLILPGVLTLLALTYFAWKRESRVLAEQLKDEVQRGVVRPGEYALLTDDRKRAQRTWQTLLQHGPLPWYFVRQFYNLESALAFRKWHTARGEPLPSSLRAYSEDAYREHIAALRTRLNAMGLSTE